MKHSPTDRPPVDRPRSGPDRRTPPILIPLVARVIRRIEWVERRKSSKTLVDGMTTG